MARQMSPRNPEMVPLNMDVESDAGLDVPAPVRRFRFAPTKAVMAAALLGVVLLAGVGVQKNYGGGSDLAKTATNTVKNFIELDEAAMKEMDPKVMPVMGVMKAWGEGLLDGDRCKETYAKFVSDDVVFDSRGVAAEAGGGKYQGIDKACKFTGKLASFPATYSSFKFDAPPYVDGNTVKLHVNYALKDKKTGKTKPTSHDAQFWHVNDEGKIDKVGFIFGSPENTNEFVGEEAPKPNDDAKVVQKMMGKWGKGEFNGDGCLDAVKGVATDDVEIEAAVPGLKTNGYKKYSGHQGWCDWCKFLTKLPFTGFEVTGFTPKEEGLIGVSVKYMLPTAEGKNSSYFHDSFLISIKKGVISGMDFNFGNAAAIDAFLGSTAKILPVMGVMKAWGAGLLDGDKCKENFAKFSADDAVTDARGTSEKGMGGKFEGIEGSCKFTGKLKSFPAAFSDFKFDAPPYVDGNTVKLHVSYNLKNKKTGKTAKERSHDAQFWHINDEGKIDKTTFIWGNPKAANDEVDAETPEANDDTKAVLAMVGKWGKGEFSGDGCLDAVKDVATDDVSIDAAVPGLKTDGYKKYTGHQGWCDWCKFLAKFPFTGFEVTGFTPKEEGEVGMAVKYMLPTADGKNSSYFHDMMMVSVKNGKISGMDFNFGNAAALDAFLGSTAKVLPVMGLMGAWGKGLLDGDKCKEIWAKFHTEDSVIDARGVSEKAWGGKFVGTEDGCKWIAQLAKFKLADFKFEAPPYVDGNTVKLGISYMLENKKTGKTAKERSFDTLFWHVNDEGKIDNWSNIYSNPAVVNSVAGDKAPEASDDAKVVGTMVGKWGKGAFHGDGCLDAVKDVATEDVSIDAVVPGMKNTDAYKKYTGHQGWCDWCKFLEKFKFTGFKITGFTAKEPGMVGMDASYMLPLPNGKNSSTYHDGIMVQTKGGLISGMNFAFGQPAGLDIYLGQNK